MGATRRRGADEDEATIDLFLMKVGIDDGDAAARDAQRAVAGLLEANPRASLHELTAADVEAYLEARRWEGDDAPAREACERFLRFVATQRPARSRDGSDEAAPAPKRRRTKAGRGERVLGMRHRKVWLGPVGSNVAAVRLVLSDVWPVVGASFFAWLMATVVPVLGSGPAGVGMTHVLANLDRRGRAKPGDLTDGLGAFFSSLIATVVQLVVIAVVAGLGVGAIMLLLWLGDAAHGLGDAPRWLAIAALVVGAATLVATLLVSNWFTFTYALIALKGLGGLEACDASRDAVRDHWIQLLLVQVVFALVAAVCNAVPILGTLLAFALWQALVYVMYRKLFD